MRSPSPRLWLQSSLVLSLAITVACTPEPLSVPETATRVTSGVKSLRPTAIRPEEQRFDDIARTAGGFGGYYVTPEGDVVAWVANASDDDAARGGVERLVPALREETRGRRLGAVRVRRAQYSFWELAQVRDFIFDHALGRVKGVHRLDLDEGNNRVSVSVEPRLAQTAITEVRQRLIAAGFDTLSVNFEAEPPATFSSTSSSALPMFFQASNLVGNFDPLVGGVAWNAQGMGQCSMGAIVDKNGVRGMISASHCSPTIFGVDGSTGYQPENSGRAFGTETADPNGTMCLWWNLQQYACRWSDAAFWSMSGAIASERGLIARTQYSTGPGGGSAGSTYLDTERPYFLVNGSAGALSQGAVVHKMGWRTGWTWGYLIETCHDAYIPLIGYIFKCQYTADMQVDLGDSGGSVFQLHQLTGDATLAGVVNGVRDNGSAIFSPWWRVSDELGGGLQVARGYNLGTPTTSGSISGTAPVISWPAVSGATKYEVFRQWFVKATGESGDDNLGFQTSGFVDYGMSVSAYTGTTYPGLNGPGWVAYYVIARNDKDRSINSTWIYFRLSQ